MKHYKFPFYVEALPIDAVSIQSGYGNTVYEALQVACYGFSSKDITFKKAWRLPEDSALVYIDGKDELINTKTGEFYDRSKFTEVNF